MHASVWFKTGHGVGESAKGSLRIGVMDAVSGQPVKNAHIVMKQGYYNEMKQSFELTTDDKGEAITSINKNYYFPYWVYTDNDKFAKTQYGWYGNAYYDNEGSRKSHSAELFTDRGVYRPGQTVHVSFIGYQQDDLNVKADSNTTIRLTLSDNDGPGNFQSNYQDRRVGHSFD